MNFRNTIFSCRCPEIFTLMEFFVVIIAILMALLLSVLSFVKEAWNHIFQDRNNWRKPMVTAALETGIFIGGKIISRRNV